MIEKEADSIITGHSRRGFIKSSIIGIGAFAIGSSHTLTSLSRFNRKQLFVDEQIKAFDIDFNWGEGGAHGFAKSGLWADADLKEHVKWYEDLGCNVIQTFGVSCNGYAWYKNGIIPEQPGLKHDFLTETIKLAHERDIKEFAYFCVGATQGRRNTNRG